MQMKGIEGAHLCRIDHSGNRMRRQVVHFYCKVPCQPRELPSVVSLLENWPLCNIMCSHRHMKPFGGVQLVEVGEDKLPEKVELTANDGGALSFDELCSCCASDFYAVHADDLWC